jgi:hypothetical protein
MDAFFPGAGWIRLERDSIAALQRFRAQWGLVSWDETVAALLSATEMTVR